MKTFRYTAIDRHGDMLTAQRIAAADRNEAIETLRGNGLILLDVVEEFRLSSHLGLNLFRRVNFQDQLYLAEQLAVLVNADIDVVQALTIIEEQTENKNVARLVRDLRLKVESGESLAAAMEQTGKFSQTFVNAVHMGTHSGRLGESLNHLVEMFRNQVEIRRKLRSAMTYPLVILVVILGAIAILNFSVLPVFIDMLQQQNLEIPWMTRIVIGFNDYLLHAWWVVLTLMLVSAYAFHITLSRESGQRWFQRLLILIPRIGRIFHYAALADFLQALGASIASGLELTYALRTIGAEQPNMLLRRYSERIRAQVENGVPLHRAMEPYPFFPPMVRHMIAIGSDAGKTEQMMFRVAKTYRDIVNEDIDNLSKLIDPVLTVLLGGVVLILFGAVMFPYFQILESL